MKKVFVMRFSGEVTIKSPNISFRWQRILLNHVKWRVKEKADVKLFHSRILVYPKNTSNELLNDIKSLFGFSSISPAFEVNTSISMIIEAMRKLKGGNEQVMVVPYKIVGISENSREFFEKLLNAMQNAGISTIKENKARRIFIEVRGEKSFLFDEIIECVGGLPYGSNDKLVSLMSGGPDSTLSTWLMMRRGSPVVGIYVPLSGIQAKKRALEAAVWLFSNWTPSREGKLYVIEIDDILDKIALHAKERTSHVIFKRCLLRIATIISMIENAKGIVTGELAGEHASQTIWNLNVISEVVTQYPIYRPVIGFDKMEVLEKIRRIDKKLFEIVNKSVEECTRIIPAFPVIKVQLSEIRRIEKLINCSWKEMLKIVISSGRIFYINEFKIEREEAIRVSSDMRKRILRLLSS